MEKSGCEPLSSAIWENNARFYNPSGFVSRGLGTSVRVTSDAVSQKVILVVSDRLEPGDWEFWANES